MLLLSYITFAVIATAVNLASQHLSFYFYSDFAAIYLAMSLGTLNGLIVKYFLDKHFIFKFKTKTKTEDASKFFLYSLMGIVTTLIFWITEVLFDYYFEHPQAKYWGAIVGLSFGYFIKYQLDKRFVFRNSLAVDKAANL